MTRFVYDDLTGMTHTEEEFERLGGVYVEFSNGDTIDTVDLHALSQILVSTSDQDDEMPSRESKMEVVREEQYEVDEEERMPDLSEEEIRSQTWGIQNLTVR